MKLTGRCYCGALRYEASGEPIMKGQCHCRECQYITGGAPNVIIGMPAEGFEYTAGTPKAFSRSDIENAVTREFCPECGTHLLTRPPGMPAVFLKVGTLDDPAVFEKPDLQIFTADAQPFHHIRDDVPAFERGPR